MVWKKVRCSSKCCSRLDRKQLDAEAALLWGKQRKTWNRKTLGRITKAQNQNSLGCPLQGRLSFDRSLWHLLWKTSSASSMLGCWHSQTQEKPNEWWRDMIHAHGQSKPWQGYLNTSEPQFQSDCCWAGSSVESEQGCSISIHPFPLSSSKYPPKHPSARAFICNTCLQTTFGIHNANSRSVLWLNIPKIQGTHAVYGHFIVWFTDGSPTIF